MLTRYNRKNMRSNWKMKKKFLPKKYRKYLIYWENNWRWNVRFFSSTLKLQIQSEVREGYFRVPISKLTVNDYRGKNIIIWNSFTTKMTYERAIKFVNCIKCVFLCIHSCVHCIRVKNTELLTITKNEPFLPSYNESECL